MEPFDIGMTGLVAVCLATLGAFALALRQRRRRAAGSRDPAGRLEDLAAAQADLEARLAALAEEARAPEERLQAMAGQLLGLIRDKNATLETALAGLDQLRARMRALEEMGEPAEARAMLEGLRGRIDALQAAQAAGIAALEARLKGPGEGVAELVERLARLQETRESGLEAVLARLGPLEARLAGFEGGLEARIEAVQGEERAARAEIEARLAAIGDRLATLEGAEAPFAEISGQLTRLYAQKDATVETVFARLAPLEARLVEVEEGMRARDPRALDRFAERLEAVQGRLASLEGAEAPFAEISAQLTRLYAQKDATVETVFARLAPLEARLAELDAGLARLAPLAEDDPRAAVEGLRLRLEGLHWAQGEVAAGLAALQAAAAEGGTLAEVADRLARLVAEKDAGVAALLERLAPLEARLAELEARPWDPEAETARAEAQAIAAQLIAARTAAEETARFADRLSELEASLPRLSAAEAEAMRAREASEAAPAAPGKPAAPAPSAEDLEAIWSLPRIVSLHHR